MRFEKFQKFKKKIFYFLAKILEYQMKKWNLIIAVICVVIIVAGVFWYFSRGEEGEIIGRDVPANGLELSSPAFNSGESIPEKYTFDGSDISPPLNISGAEGETLAIIMDDPDAPGGTFTHWLIWNIPTDTTQIPENVLQEETVGELGNSVQGTNDFGEIGYRGPKPPEGEEHEYRIFLYTLDGELDLNPGAKKGELGKAMEGHILQKTKITGFYDR